MPARKPPRVPLPGIAQILLGVWAMDRFAAYLLRGPAIRTMKIPSLGEVVAVRDPEALATLFTAGPEVADAAEVNVRLLRGLGQHSLMLLDGPEHLRMRRMLLPPFHGEAVQAYAELIEAIVEAEISGWPLGTGFPVQPAMQRIALESILRAVIGVSDSDRAGHLRAALPKVLEASPLAFIAEARFPRLGHGLPGRLLPWMRARAAARDLIATEIRAHRASDRGEDVLAMLIGARDDRGLALSDEEIEDQLLTLLLAGHETTASTLAFCFERLARHPAVLARLTEEIRGGNGEQRYLDAVIDETQRARPVVEVTWRILKQPLALGGYELPAGTIVMPVIRGTHESAVFDAAAEFRPERFLDRRPAPYTLIPFGGGGRRCLGASFARLEIKTVLRTVLGRLDLGTTRAPAERRDRSRRFSTIPGKGGRVAFRPRPIETRATSA